MDIKNCAAEIMNAAGGKENVAQAAGCDTRLRLVLRETGRADQNAMKDIAGVKGVFESGGQLQVILGKDNADKVYKEFMKQLEGTEEEEPAKEETTVHIRRSSGRGILMLLILTLLVFATGGLEIFMTLHPDTEFPGIFTSHGYIIIWIVLYAVLCIAAILKGRKDVETVTVPDVPAGVPYREQVVMRCDAGEVVSPVPGRVFDAAETGIETFASGVLGEGVAVVPETELLLSPAAGEIKDMSLSSGKIGIDCECGIELLLFLGSDTKGAGRDDFEPYVKEGQKVRKGQPLVKFRSEALKGDGEEPLVIMIAANADEVGGFEKVLPVAAEE